MLVVRKASLEDSKDLFDWRNDFLTRQMSHTTDPVDWDDHAKWFTASLSNKNRVLAICEKASTHEKVAVVRFDLNKDCALVSINIAPNQKPGSGV